MNSKVLAFVLLAACLAATAAAFPEQSVCTFTPPNPGFLHNDRFSVLDNDRVRVDRFNAPELAAGVLDFQNADTVQTVTLGLTGGIAFDSESVSLASGGAGSFTSGSGLSINALLGSVDFIARDDVTAVASGGDFDLDSQDGNVNINAADDLIIDAAQVLFDGKFDNLGVTFSTSSGGDITLRAGDLPDGQTGFGNIDIKGSDVTMSSALFTLQSVDDSLTVSSQGNQVYAGETMSLGASDSIDITSDLADIVIDSGANTSINGASVGFEAGNRARLRSVHDSVAVAATGDVDVASRDHVHFIATGAEPLARDASDCSGVSIAARDSITMSAVQNVDLIAQGAGGVTVTAGSLELTADFGGVVIGSEQTDSTNISATGAADVSADGSINFAGQSAVALDSAGLATFEADNLASVSGASNVAAFAGNNFNMNFDRYFGEFSGDANLSGDGIVVSVDDFDVSAGNDVEIVAGNNVSLFYSDLILSGEEVVSLSADDVLVNLNDNLEVNSAGNINFSTESGDIEFVLNGNFAVDGDHGSHEFFGTALSVVAAQQASSVNSEIVSHSSVNILAGDDASFAADEDVAVTAAGQLVIDNESFTSNAAGDATLAADNDIHVNAQGTITMSTSAAAGPSSQTFNGESVYITSGEFVEFNAVDLTLDVSGETYFNTRDPLGFAASDDLVIDSSSVSSFASATFIEFIGEVVDVAAGEDLTITATDGLGGEIRFASTAGSISLIAEDDTTHTGARHIISAASVDFSGNILDITQEGPFGQINFEAAGPLTAAAGTDIRVDSASSVFAAENDLSFTATEEFIVTPETGNEIDVAADADMIFTSSANILFMNDIIDIQFLNEADIDISGDVTITSLAGVFFNGDEFINVEVEGAVSVDTLDELNLSATETTTLSGGAIDVTGSVSLDLISGGGGFVNTAERDIIFRTTGPLASTTTDENHFVSQTGDILVNAEGDLLVSGGNSTYHAQEDISFTSEGTLDIRTSRPETHVLQNSPGNLGFFSGDNAVYTVEEGQFQLLSAGRTYPIQPIPSGNNPSNFADGGGNGHIATTAEGANICIETINPADGTTTFASAENMLVAARGVGAGLEMFADGSSAHLSEASIGLTSNGFSTDSFNLVDDNYGALFRAARGDATGNIVVDSEAGLSVFGQDGFFITAQDSLSVSAADVLSIQATGHDADISIFTTDGELSFIADDDAEFVAGSETTIANIHVNSTATQTWVLDDTTINQLGANSDLDRNAITFEAFGGPMSVTSEGLTLAANQDGGIIANASNGDITITADDEARFVATTSSVSLSGQAGVVIDTSAGAGQIEVDSASSINLMSSGGENISITSVDNRLFFTAPNGELEAKSTGDFTANAVNDVDLEGPCAAVVGGGSVEVTADGNIDLISAQDIRFDADVEFTADATTRFTVTAEEAVINAGGDQSTTGVSVQSNFEANFAAENIVLSALSTVMQADTDFAISSIADAVSITSTAPIGTNDNFLVQSANGNLVFSAVTTLEIAGEQLNTVDAGGVVTFTADSAEFLSARETLIDVATDYTATTVADITFDQASGLWDVVGDILASALNLSVQSDYELNLEASSVALTADADAIQFSSAVGTDLTFVAAEDMTVTSDVTAFIVVNDRLDIDTADFFATSDLIDLSAEDDFLTSTFDDIIVTLGASFALLGSENVNVEASTADFLAATSIAADPRRTIIEANRSIDFNSVDLTITAPTDSILVFESVRGSVTLSADTYVATSESDDIDFGGDDIEITADTIDYTIGGSVNVVSEGGLVTLNLLGLTTDAAFTEFVGAADEGTLVLSEGIVDVTAPTIRSSTDGGNLHLSAAEGPITISATNELDLLSVGENADVNINADTQIYTAVTQLEIGARADASNVLGDGMVSMSANTRISFEAETADFASESDVRVAGDSISLTANVVDFNGAAIKVETPVAQLLGGASLSLFTSGDLSDIVLSGGDLDLITPSLTATADEISLVSSGVAAVLFDALLIDSANHLLLKSGNDVSFNVNGDFSVSAGGGDDNGIFFDNSAIGSGEFSSTSTALLLNGDTDIDIRAKDLIYATANEVVGETITYRSARDVWFLSEEMTIIGDSAIFGTQGEGNFNLDTRVLSMTATNSFVVEARGDLGLLGGRYTANSLPGTTGYVAVPRNFQINIDGIEARNVNGDTIIDASEDVVITSLGGSIEIRGTYDIQYDVSRASGHIGFFGVLETFPAFGVYNAIGFDRETDYCQSVAGNDRCDANTNCVFSNTFGCNAARTCNVVCPDISDVVNDIAVMLVSHNLVDCTGGDNSFCCIFPNC